MAEFFAKILDTEGFPARWHCGEWSAGHGWLHVLSDAAIFGAYAAIPLVIVVLVRKRRDFPFVPVFWLFGAFIFACGLGHLIEASIFWMPWYRLSGIVKLVTAVVSWATVVALVYVFPRALALPARLLETEVKHDDELLGLHDAAIAMNRSESLEEALRCITVQAVETIGAHRAVTTLAPGSESEPPRFAVVSTDADVYAGTYGDTPSPADVAVGAYVRKEQRATRFTRAELGAQAGVASPEGDGAQPTSWLATPLVAQDGSHLGTLQVSGAREFSERDRRMLVQLAELVSAAAELRRSNEDLARMVEARTRELAELNETLHRNNTELARTADKLRKSESRLELALEASSIGVWRWNLETDLFEGDGRCHRIFGVTADQIRSLVDFEAFVHPADREATVTTLRHAAESGRRCRVDYRIARPDGAQRHVEAIGDVLPDEDGQVRVMLGVCQDITSRKKAELHWRRFANEIARRNQELDDFAYVVSHDLKAPLRGIVSMATWLLEDHREGLDADGQDLLEKICARTARMDALIEGILEYSRVGRGEGDLEEVASRTVVLESVELLGVPDRISVEVAPDLPTVTYNRTRLAQVFQNLIGNAIRYMGPDGGTVRVACEVEGGFYAFSVSDTGPGIEEQHHQRIFKIFQRLDPKAHSKATGVGLSIVKKCVELYGGQIRLKSRPGEGSRFTFTVPRRPSLRMTREFDIDAIEQTA